MTGSPVIEFRPSQVHYATRHPWINLLLSLSYRLFFEVRFFVVERNWTSFSTTWQTLNEKNYCCINQINIFVQTCEGKQNQYLFKKCTNCTIKTTIKVSLLTCESVVKLILLEDLCNDHSDPLLDDVVCIDWDLFKSLCRLPLLTDLALCNFGLFDWEFSGSGAWISSYVYIV